MQNAAFGRGTGRRSTYVAAVHALGNGPTVLWMVRAALIAAVLLGCIQAAVARPSESSGGAVDGGSAPPPESMGGPELLKVRVPRTEWSSTGWQNVRWRMGTADAIAAVRGTGGEAWHPSDQDKQMLGMAADLAYAVVLDEPILDRRFVAILKFHRSRLFGVLLVSPPDGKGLPAEECQAQFGLFRRMLTNKYGAAGDCNPSIFDGSGRCRWDSTRVKLLLRERRNEAGCFLNITYTDPTFEVKADPAALERQLIEWGEKARREQDKL